MKEKQKKQPENVPGTGSEGVADCRVSPNMNGCGRILHKRRDMSNLTALRY